MPWPLVLGSWTLILCLDPYYWVYWRLIFCLARSTGVYVCVCLYVCGRAGRRAGVRVICAMYMCARACPYVCVCMLRVCLCVCACAFVRVCISLVDWYCMRYSVLRRVNINVLLNLAVCHVLLCLCLVLSLCLYLCHIIALFSCHRCLKVSPLKNEEFLVTNVCSKILSYNMCVYCDYIN